MQGAGQLAAAVVALIVTVASQDSLRDLPSTACVGGLPGEL